MNRLSDTLKPLIRFARTPWADGLAVIVSVIVAVAVFSVFAQARATVGPLQVGVSVAPARSGTTAIQIPPFGTVSAATHRGPVAVRLIVDDIDVDAARALLEDESLDTAGMLAGRIPRQLSVEKLPTALREALLKGVLAAVALGALIVLAFRRRWQVIVVTCVVIAAITCVPAAVAARSWDATAFREPTLRGSLAYAPALTQLFTARLDRIGKLREQAQKVVRDIASYYADERLLDTGGTMAGAYRVLHVTDLHLDPVGAALAEQIVRSYDVSLVVDTGDIAVLGSDIEGRAIPSLVATSVPVVYVPGNHDSHKTVEVLQSLPNVTVVESGTVDVDGVRIFGVPDPFSRGFGLEPEPAATEQAGVDAFERLSAALASGETTPDIVAIHNPAMEKPFIGSVPIILSGHTHAARAYVSQDTLRLNSGSLGGMPYDPELTGRRPVPHSATVLYFTADEPRSLLAIDEISVTSDGATTVRRKVFSSESAF